MRKYLDSTDKINSIRLQLRHPSGKNKIWVLVEGENDQRIFSLLIDGKDTKVEQVHGGVEHLREAVDTLIKETDQVIGIRDADFLHLEGIEEEITFLFITDFHDMEMMMISSDKTLMSVIAEYLDINTHVPHSLRNQILQSIHFLGGIRWFNHKHNTEINFKGISLGSFYNGENLTIDNKTCVDEINKRSPHKKIEIKEDDILKFLPEKVDLLHLCCGHDFEKALALFISSKSKKGVTATGVGQALRLSYTKEEFSKTELFKQLKSWESNSQFLLFDNEPNSKS